jgi:hypothetical protein
MIPAIWMTQGIDGNVLINNSHKDLLNLVDVNRTVRHRFTQLFPFIQVPFKRFGMDIVVFGTDVAIDGVRQGDSIGSLEGDRQLVRHLAVLIPPGSNAIKSVGGETNVYNIGGAMTEREWWHQPYRERMPGPRSELSSSIHLPVLCGCQYNHGQLRSLLLAMLCTRGEYTAQSIIASFRRNHPRHSR